MDKDNIYDIVDMDGVNRNRSYLKNKYPSCKICNHYLYLDDIDYDFEGKQDEYWLCSHCKASMMVYVRYNKVYGITFKQGEENG